MISVAWGKFLCFSFSLVVILSATASGAADPEENFQFTRTEAGLTLHKEMFMLPVTISNEYDGDRTEAVFQISAKHRIFGTKFYFGFTQISFWQAYDSDNSAPFRETNYNPELFYRPDRFDFWSGRVGADIGFEHESNGQIPPVSRSWNLLYAAPYYYNANLLVYLKLRYRIPEEKKRYPLDAEGDDNPDITDYLGYSDLKLFYIFPWNHSLHIILRGNLNTGKGGVVVNYNWLIPKGKFSYCCIRISHGYGESLVDYNRSMTRIGLGIMFAR